MSLLSRKVRILRRIWLQSLSITSSVKVGLRGVSSKEAWVVGRLRGFAIVDLAASFAFFSNSL